MSDATNEEIKEAFKRQVRLCAGIGMAAMLEIVHEQFYPAQKPQCQHH